MKKVQNEFVQVKVGIFVFIALALVMTAIFSFGSRTSYFKSYYTLSTYFDDISGLVEGSQVQLAGVGIGFVKDIAFVEVDAVDQKKINTRGSLINSGGIEIQSTGVKIRVDLKLESRFQSRIREDTVASITQQGLLGDSIVFLSVGSARTAMLEDGQEIIHVMNPSGFGQLKTQGEDLLKSADQLLGNVNGLLTDVKTKKGLLNSLIYDEKASQIIEKADVVVENLGKTTENVSNITAKIDSGEGTLGKFVNDPGVYEDLRTLLGKANRNKLVRSVIRYTLATREGKIKAE